MAAESNLKIADYAAKQAAVRLDRLAYQIARGRKSRDPDSVHDLRVSIRRFQSCLRAFRDYFPSRQTKKIQSRLREIMKLAGEVRNRDIALDLARKAGLPRDGLVTTTWSKQRNQAAKSLAAALKRSIKRNHSDKWRSRLGL